MPLLILMTILLLVSWLFSELFVVSPLIFLNSLKPFFNLTLVLALVTILWCFGD